MLMFVLSVWNPVYVLHLQPTQIRTSPIACAPGSRVASGCLGDSIGTQVRNLGLPVTLTPFDPMHAPRQITQLLYLCYPICQKGDSISNSVKPMMTKSSSNSEILQGFHT